MQEGGENAPTVASSPMEETSPTPEPVQKYTAALIESAAQINSIVVGMIHFSEEHPHPRAKPVLVVLSELVEGILADNLASVEPSAIETAAALLSTATEAIGSDLFFVDPKLIEEHGIPDLN
jgi:hypothetical protein